MRWPWQRKKSVEILLIGTYHKTGTVWMQRVFNNLAKTLGTNFRDSDFGPELTNPVPGYYLQDHSQFPQSLFKANHSGFRMIRDPRDVVISGTHYHLKSHESWLHEPRADMDGMSYQQALNACATPVDQYLFEMKNVAYQTCQQMVADFDRLPEFATVRYETWITDPDMKDFEATMQRLGFSGADLAAAKDVFFKFSLFGERKHVDQHTRSGKVHQWRNVYTREMADSFIALYGDALIQLGYEENHDWVTALPDG